MIIIYEGGLKMWAGRVKYCDKSLTGVNFVF